MFPRGLVSDSVEIQVGASQLELGLADLAPGEATLEDLGSRHEPWRGFMRVRDAVGLSGGDEIRLGTASLVYCVVMPNDTTRD